MPKRHPIQDEYEHCEPKVLLGGKGKYIRLAYTADVDSHCDLRFLDAAISESVGRFNDTNAPTKLNYERRDLEPADNNKRIEFDVFAVDTKGAATTMSSGNLTNLAHILASRGCVPDKASKYIRDVADGAILPAPEPVNVPAAPAPSTTIQGPAASPSITKTGGQLALLPALYKECKPIIGLNSLALSYTMNGPVNSPMILQDFNALKANIENAITSIPWRRDGSKLVVSVHSLQSLPATNGGIPASRFIAKFDREIQGVKKRLQYQDMIDISDYLKAGQCLADHEAKDFTNKLAARVVQTGWMNTP